ncbi:MAG: YqhG/Tai3 family protein [Candidatus Xenobia bacterium]
MKRFLLSLLLVACLMPCRVVAEPNDPKGVAAGFYEWYMTHQSKMPEALAEQRENLTPQLYRLLMAGYKANHIDFDPFVNAQWSAQHYLIGRVERHGKQAEVHVSLQLERSGSTSLTLLMTETQQEWQIADIRYPAEGSVKSWTLLHLLKQ